MRRNLRRENLAAARRPKWWQIPEWPEEDDPSAYDRDDMMVAIDAMDPQLRALVNEHGYTAVYQCRRETADIELIQWKLERRRAVRQMQLATGMF